MISLLFAEADCSIVMAEGDPATRQIANIVLLNSDFNDVPEILFEGRRVVNNIGRIAPIFLYQNDLFLPLGYYLYRQCPFLQCQLFAGFSIHPYSNHLD